MLRIGIGQIWQETNHFSPVKSTRADFESFCMHAGHGDWLAQTTGEEVGGFRAGLKSWMDPIRPAGLLAAQAWPSGPLTSDARRWLIEELSGQLAKQNPFDAILFSLHGGLCAEDEVDMDGLILQTIREHVADNVPVVATVDLHAHVSDRMLHHADAIVAYHTNPHLDRFDTGRRAADVMQRLLQGANPCVSSVRLPMIVSGEVTNTSREPLKQLFSYLGELESRHEILSASIFMTQPYLDVADSGWSTMVVTDGDFELAQRLSDDLAQACWDARDTLGGGETFFNAEQAVQKALATPGKPVVIADGADATNSGAPGDSVHLVSELMKHSISDRGALAIMVDPEAVAYAASIGPGARFDFAIGGKRDHVFSTPVTVSGCVEFIRPARYILGGHLGDALPIDMGRAAAVRVNDVTILLVEKAGPGSSPMMYRCVGLEPRDFKIVIVKSPAGFRAEFEPFAADIILTACPGCAMSQLQQVPYTRVNRPLWPLDEISDWRSVPWCKAYRYVETSRADTLRNREQ
jgi:microcystin degradation protein MlrC